MVKKIFVRLGVAVGLGLALLYLLFQESLVKPPAPTIPEQTQAASKPAPVPTPTPGAPGSQPPVTREPNPPVPGPASPPALVTVPTPTPAPPQEEKKIAPLPPLTPKQEHALLAGRFHQYKDAKRELEKIQKQKLPALIRKQGKYYQVWVGPFPTPQEAEHARKSLRAALKISPQAGKLELPVAK